MAEQLIALWQEAEEHLQAFQQYARRTVEEAWLAGDALMRIREQLPHGGWRSGLEERGITKSTAHRFISLRKKYPEMSQVGTFSSVSAALTAKSRNPEIETRNPNTEPQDQPPAQPKLLDEPEAAQALDEPPQAQEPPTAPQEQLQAAQAHDEPPELQEPQPAQPGAVDELPQPPEARDQPPAQPQAPLAREQPTAPETPTPSPGTRSPSSGRSEFRQLTSPGSGLPPFQRQPPFPAPRTSPPPQEKALPAPADAHAEPQRRIQLRLRTPRLLLPGSHTAFRLGLSCFVDVDDAAENKNAAPNPEQRPDNPAADKLSDGNM